MLLPLAGDSRAVVMADGQVVAHTEEHRAEREDEQVSRHLVQQQQQHLQQQPKQQQWSYMPRQ
jgi:serine/threonine protein phosphatase PrpC